MKPTFHVLLVEDNRGDAELVREWLSDDLAPSFDLAHVTTLADALAALTAPLDAVLVDLNLPDSRGLATVERIAAAAGDAPVIVVTGSLDATLRAAALAAGAEDVFTKDAPIGSRLLRSVVHLIERNQAREGHRQVERVLDAIPDAILIVEHDGAVSYVNRAAPALFGRPRDELVGERLGFSVKDGEPSELTVLNGDRVRLCEMRVVPFTWDGRPASLCSIRDVTSARDGERRFQRLSESGLIGVVTLDLGGAVLDANDRFLELIGASRAHPLTDLRWAPLLAPGQEENAARVSAALTTAGIAAPRELDLVRGDGAIVPVMFGAALLEHPRVIGFTVDLSERRRAEEARRRAEDTLRQAEDRLRQSQKMEAIGRLAGGVAHDFNNVLSVILSYASFILSSLRPDDPLRVEIEEIQRAGERAASLTRQLLLFSRQTVVTPRVLDLDEILRTMQRMLERILGEDVELETRVAGRAGRIEADRGSIEQVILNLVVNARDAMPTGGTLTIEVADVVLADEPGVRPGAHVMLAVRDTGIGMDQEVRRRIFEPFFTTKEAGKGTGLGLATVFGIVQQSGGTITVESEPGLGTTFRLYFPRIDLPADEVQAQAAVTQVRGSETILLVEDEDQVRAVARSILRRQGYRVLEARNAGEAFLICQQDAQTIDLLVTDVVMPQMSGPELARRLAATRPTMKVLCMSGYADDNIVRHGVAADVAFLQKPITPRTLASKVREVLDGPPRRPRP